MAGKKSTGSLPDIAAIKKEAKSTPKWMYALLAVVLVIAGFSVAPFFTGGKDSTTSQSEPTSGVTALPSQAPAETANPETGNPEPITVKPGIADDGTVTDEPFDDEFFGYVLKELRAEWGDGTSPHLNDSIATHSLIYSVENLNQPMPNISALWAKQVSGSLDAADGIAFKDKNDKTVITFYFDNTAIRQGDDNFIRFAYTSIDQSYINSGRVPLMKNDVTSLKDSANLMAYSLYTTGGDASSIAGYFPQGATPSAPAVSKMESYKPLFIATDYSQPADGVYITVQPMGADQTMTFKFVSSGTGYAPANIFTGEAVM